MHGFAIASTFYHPIPMPHPPGGLNFIYLETQTLDRNKVVQTIDLKQFGFKVRFPPNTFLEPVVDITVGVGLSGDFIPPRNTSLVSALYYIKASSELLQPVTVEIEHCVNIVWDHDNDDINRPVTFGKADTLSKCSPPHVFKRLPGGRFARNSWETIELSSFSTIGVFGDENAPCIDYLAYLLKLRYKGRPAIYDVSIVTSRKLSAIKEVIICYHIVVYYHMHLLHIIIGCEKRVFRMGTNHAPI